MNSTPRRPGFRLPWSADAEQPTDAAPDAQPGAPATAGEPSGAEPTPAMAATDHAPVAGAPGATSPLQPSAAEMPASAASSPAAADAAPGAIEAPDAPAATSGPADPFLQDLVDAMRKVAEEARDRSLSELRALVEKRVEQVGERGAERAEDLRRRSELDIKGFGDWERDEQERIRAEAEGKVAARRQQLEEQLHGHSESTERDVAAMRARLADHERQLGAFFTQLAEIKDPAAFVTAAKRMPAAPSLEAAAVTQSPPPAPRADESLASRLTMLGIDKEQGAPAVSANGTAAPVEAPSPEPSLEERLAELDRQLQPAAEGGAAAVPAQDANGEVATGIVVKGLGSFGAITSFKQSLEKVVGIRSVSLSLGPTGEFVYRATHDADFDVAAVISGMENGNAEMERQSDGTLRVTVNRSR